MSALILEIAIHFSSGPWSPPAHSLGETVSEAPWPRDGHVAHGDQSDSSAICT